MRAGRRRSWGKKKNRGRGSPTNGRLGLDAEFVATAGRVSFYSPIMNVLLFSMPDSFEHTPPLTMRMPNGALASLAGNVDPHHHVAIADLVLAQASVPQTVERLVRSHRPDVVGLSIMTFQRSHGAPRHCARPSRRAVRAHRGRRIRSEPGAARVRSGRVRRGCESCAARAT